MVMYVVMMISTDKKGKEAGSWLGNKLKYGLPPCAQNRRAPLPATVPPDDSFKMHAVKNATVPTLFNDRPCYLGLQFATFELMVVVFTN
jgi:hypothetical protein